MLALMRIMRIVRIMRNSVYKSDLPYGLPYIACLYKFCLECKTSLIRSIYLSAINSCPVKWFIADGP